MLTETFRSLRYGIDIAYCSSCPRESIFNQCRAVSACQSPLRFGHEAGWTKPAEPCVRSGDIVPELARPKSSSSRVRDIRTDAKRVIPRDVPRKNKCMDSGLSTHRPLTACLSSPLDQISDPDYA